MSCHHTPWQRVPLQLSCSPLQALEGCCEVSLSSHERWYSPLVIFVAASGLLTGPCPSCAGCPRAEHRLQVGSHKSSERGVTPLALLVMLLLMQPWTVVFLGCKHTSTIYVELLINQHSWVLLIRAALNPFFTQPVFVLDVAQWSVILEAWKQCSCILLTQDLLFCFNSNAAFWSFSVAVL